MAGVLGEEKSEGFGLRVIGDGRNGRGGRNGDFRFEDLRFEEGGGCRRLSLVDRGPFPG